MHGGSHSLRCDLDELLEELHSLAELRAQTHLGHHPQLHLVEPAQEQVQVGRGPAEVLPAERVVQQLVLAEERDEGFLSESLHFSMIKGYDDIGLHAILQFNLFYVF